MPKADAYRIAGDPYAIDADAIIDAEHIPTREEQHDTAAAILDVRDTAAATTAAIVAAAPKSVTSWTPSFAISVDEAIERKEQKHRFFKHVMVPDLHYGIIPGATKPALYKAGAEMLLANMGLNAELDDEDVPTIDVTGKLYGEPYIRYRRICRIYRQLGPSVNERMIVAKASGSCSSWEPKYRYRNDKLKCPACGKSTIIKQKDFSGQDRDMGWLCWKKEGKSDGCAAKFNPGDKAIAGQVVGKVANPDVADLENTILKMGDKRALVAATLIGTGCSDIFTQDIEDQLPDPDAGSSATEPLDLRDHHDPKPQPAQRKVTPAPDRDPRAKSAAGAKKNAYYARIRQLTDQLELEPDTIVSVLSTRYAREDGEPAQKVEHLTYDQLVDYGTWLKEQVDDVIELARRSPS